MAQYAECDECGARDDWGGKKGPILENGAVIQLRTDDGSEKPACTLEICPACKEKLLHLFPKLGAAFKDACQ